MFVGKFSREKMTLSCTWRPTFEVLCSAVVLLYGEYWPCWVVERTELLFDSMMYSYSLVLLLLPLVWGCHGINQVHKEDSPLYGLWQVKPFFAITNLHALSSFVCFTLYSSQDIKCNKNMFFSVCRLIDFFCKHFFSLLVSFGSWMLVLLWGPSDLKKLNTSLYMSNWVSYQSYLIEWGSLTRASARHACRPDVFLKLMSVL